MISSNIDVQEYRQAIGVLANRSDTEQALQILKEHKFPMEQVSVIAQDSELENDVPQFVEIQSQIKSPMVVDQSSVGLLNL